MRTFTHALLARIVSVLLFSLLVQAPILESRESAPLPPRPPQSFGRPGFLIQIQSALNPEPRIILTNLSEEPLTAVYLQMYSSTENRKRSGELWDAFLQNRSPLAKDVGISLSLSHAVGERIPDKVEVAAAIWADGTTFGPPDQLKRILQSRLSGSRTRRARFFFADGTSAGMDSRAVFSCAGPSASGFFADLRIEVHTGSKSEPRYNTASPAEDNPDDARFFQ